MWKTLLWLLSLHFSGAAVDCGRLPTPLNGSLSGEETTYPNRVEIKCDEGFILRGSRERTCHADGRWDGSQTSCKGNELALLIISRYWLNRMTPHLALLLISSPQTAIWEEKVYAEWFIFFKINYLLHKLYSRKYGHSYYQKHRIWSGANITF